MPSSPATARRLAQERCDRERARRASTTRARTISTRRITIRDRKLIVLQAIDYPEDVERPRTRGDCIGGERPCPWVSCQHNLYLDVSPRTGSIKLNFPDREPWEMVESCALDVADRGGETLEAVGAVMNLTKERCRQLEAKACGKLEDLAEWLEEEIP